MKVGDWHVLWESAPKILHIDVLSFPPRLDATQAEDINAFLERGGGFALGVLPNTDEGYSKPVMETLEDNLENCLQAFLDSGISIDLLGERSMISTQCGLSRASVGTSREIHETSNLFARVFSKMVQKLV